MENRMSISRVHLTPRLGKRMEDLISEIISQDIPLFLRSWPNDPSKCLVFHSYLHAKQQIHVCHNNTIVDGLNQFMSFMEEQYGYQPTPYSSSYSNPWDIEIGCAFFEAYRRKLAFYGEDDSIVEWLEYIVQVYNYVLNPQTVSTEDVVEIA